MTKAEAKALARKIEKAGVWNTFVSGDPVLFAAQD